MAHPKTLSAEQSQQLLDLLEARFRKNMKRHENMKWEDVATRLNDKANAAKMGSLFQMEETGGEPDVIGKNEETGEYVFCDCAAESPKGRRSLCYDREALNARKEYKPADSALDMAEAMGIELLDESQYRRLQQLGEFDTKTSSWIQTPPEIRKLGGALFCDRRYNTVFVYHNGADSYYAARGFRGLLNV